MDGPPFRVWFLLFLEQIRDSEKRDFRLEFHEPEADHQGLIHAAHGVARERAETLDESFLIDGTDLIEKHGGMDLHASLGSIDQNFVSGRRLVFRGDSCDNGQLTVPVSNIVLDDERGTCFLNFNPDGGIKTDQVYVASPDAA